MNPALAGLTALLQTPRMVARRMIVRLVPRTLALALVLALAACGFSLRDALVLPPDLGPVQVVSVDRYSPLADSLAQSLTRAGAVPATSRTENPAVLEVLAEEWGDTPISVDTFGRAQEFSLRYAVIFELRKADGSMLVPRQTIELSRDYISVPTQSQGAEGERDILVRELQREMAASVLRRIDAVARRGELLVDGQASAGSTAPLDADAGVEADADTEVDADADIESDAHADEAAVDGDGDGPVQVPHS
ncbi:LPS-assembly lipoprotein LptE [Lysobacter sp. D1-1-M9]|uniref:LPS-assembly lipoprotein LptE n=1 Tax=Novilysobacter longmucuonensis TaxID=3098603 RepID=UPI002FCB0544